MTSITNPSLRLQLSTPWHVVYGTDASFIFVPLPRLNRYTSPAKCKVWSEWKDLLRVCVGGKWACGRAGRWAPVGFTRKSMRVSWLWALTSRTSRAGGLTREYLHSEKLLFRMRLDLHVYEGVGGLTTCINVWTWNQWISKCSGISCTLRKRVNLTIDLAQLK